ncbi:MAG: quinone oxidoreductase [Deltaproteobacteria bacterium]|nr:quinone oxidoreductase [Deltaproteobacteria bacterium]
MKRILARRHGGADEMRLEEAPVPDPGPGQALVRVEAAGVNFIDVYLRTGLYGGTLPVAMGLEGAGVVETVGEGAGLAAGARVAWTGIPGSYATHVLAPADRLVPLPAGIDARSGAAAMLQGMTAHYLVHSTARLAPGDACLVHAAAGGVGLLLCQMARSAGARVIGTVSTAEKAALSRAAGAGDVVLYRDEDFEAAVRRLTEGRGVRVVFDSVGKDTFERSLGCLAPRGLCVLYGASSGPVSPFDPQVLNAKGSVFLTRPSLNHHIATREELMARAGDVLGWIAQGKLKLRIGGEYPLAEAARAHSDLEARRTTGKLLLIP